MSAAITN
jgi:hypothetical protein